MILNPQKDEKIAGKWASNGEPGQGEAMGWPAHHGLRAAGRTAEIWGQMRHMPKTGQGSPLYYGRQLHVDDVPLRTSAG